jgi:hypothetical protein
VQEVPSSNLGSPTKFLKDIQRENPPKVPFWRSKRDAQSDSAFRRRPIRCGSLWSLSRAGLPGPCQADVTQTCAIMLLQGAPDSTLSPMKDLVKVAAYQAPLLASGSMDALSLIQTRVKWCEAVGATILCCPEAILGGLADYSEHPAQFALAVDSGRLDSTLAPLESDTVTTIVGFTELADGGRLYNSAAVFHRGSVIGLYRKLYPAINRSVYEAGRKFPVFQVGKLTLGIVICSDSN